MHQYWGLPHMRILTWSFQSLVQVSDLGSLEYPDRGDVEVGNENLDAWLRDAYGPFDTIQAARFAVQRVEDHRANLVSARNTNSQLCRNTIVPLQYPVPLPQFDPRNGTSSPQYRADGISQIRALIWIPSGFPRQYVANQVGYGHHGLVCMSTRNEESPLGIGDCWYRFLGRTVVKALGAEVGLCLLPTQLGVGVPGGYEIGARLPQIL
jgi:hypothetical protein